MVNPSRLLLLLIYLGAMILLLLLVSPGKLDVAGHQLVMPTWESVTGQRNKIANITEVIDMDRRLDSLENARRPSEQSVVSNPTVNDNSREERGFRTINHNFRPTDQPIAYPGGSGQTALSTFFDGLIYHERYDTLLRISHLGDSQLEGDRITDYLRYRMQQTFGGCGPGLLPLAEPAFSRSSISLQASDNWQRYDVFGEPALRSKHTFYGVLGSYFTYSQSASLQLSPMRMAYRGNNKVEQMRLFFRNPEERTQLSFQPSNGQGGKLMLPVSYEPTLAEIPFSGALEELNLNFAEGAGLELYALAIDGRSGIAVDNIPMRGSSGTEFSRMHRRNLSQLSELLNTKLLIFQFGVNVVPAVSDSYAYYEHMLYDQLMFLKSINRQASILVVGVSDMAKRQGPDLLSYKNISAVRDAQKRAAFRAGCAFWDLYEAMGGEHAIISWVRAEPPLAQRDFTHFTRRGAKLVGEMLFNALMVEYTTYRAKTATNSATQ